MSKDQHETLKYNPHCSIAIHMNAYVLVSVDRYSTSGLREATFY